MDIKDFKAGTYQEGYKYRYFKPETINHPWILSITNTRKLSLKAQWAPTQRKTHTDLSRQSFVS